jgi:hypothetical protein
MVKKHFNGTSLIDWNTLTPRTTFLVTKIWLMDDILSPHYFLSSLSNHGLKNKENKDVD